MRYLSVCSGIEAATQAWHPLGWEPAGFAEIEPFPCHVLHRRYGASQPIHMPSGILKGSPPVAACVNAIAAVSSIPEYDGTNIPNFGDFTKIDHETLGPIDLLVGGTPCQSFSIAGLRKGMDDDRGNLALEFVRLAMATRPRWIVWENVPGVLSSNEGRDFGSFLGALGEIGYGFAHRVLDAQFFGLAQRRKRVFVVGYLGDWRPAAAVLSEQESMRGNPPPSREKREEATDGPTHSLTGEGFYASEDGTGRGTPLVSHTLGAHGGSGRSDAESETFIPTLGIDGEANVLEERQPALRRGGQGGRDESVAIRTANTGANGHGVSKGVAHTLDRGQGQAVAFQQNTRDEVRLMGGDGQIAGALADSPGMKQQNYIASTLLANCGKTTGGGGKDSTPRNVVTTLAIRGRGEGRDMETRDDGTANAILTPNGGRDGMGVGAIQFGYTVRRLTPRECERLQGFPDDYTRIPWRGKDAANCPDGPRYKALGNSMAVPVMRWIGERINQVEEILAGATP